MIITIDGPTASGKSTVAQRLAKTLHFYYLNSGFLYRSLAYYCAHHALEWLHASTDQISSWMNNVQYTYDTTAGTVAVYIEGKRIDALFLKAPEIDTLASKMGENAAVRTVLYDLQRQLVGTQNAVVEGRDSGTIVFPQAEYKFFITAHEDVRANRWQHHQEKQGIYMTAQTALKLLQERDARDTSRLCAPLCSADDARCIDTSMLNIDQVVQKIVGYVQEHTKK